MYPIVLAIHVIVCLLIVLVILIQAGRSGGLSGFLGAGGGDALFSTSSQQSGLRKFTLILAVLFFFTSFGLTILKSRTPRTVLARQYPNLPPIQQPAAPEVPAGENPMGMPGAPAAPQAPDNQGTK